MRLDRLFRSSKTRPAGGPRRRPAARLSLEALGDRADSGPGSLRQAVLDANANPGADVIDFADGLTGTIGLTGGQLDVTDALTIDGPGADRLAVSGSGTSRVLQVAGGVAVAVDDL